MQQPTDNYPTAGRPDLAELRHSAVLTQTQLAAAANLTQTGLGLIETGRTRPRPGTIRALAEALSLTPQQVSAACDESRRRRPGNVRAGHVGQPNGNHAVASRISRPVEEAPGTGATTRVRAPARGGRS